MVKINIDLDMRRRERHFNTNPDNQRRNATRIHEMMKMVNNYFNCFGLRMKEVQLINMEGDENPELKLSFQNNPRLDHQDIRKDCQILRERLNLTEIDYKTFQGFFYYFLFVYFLQKLIYIEINLNYKKGMLSVHLNGIPKLCASNQAKKRMNQIFPIASNDLGWFVSDPIRKIKMAAIEFLSENSEFSERTFSIKISGKYLKIFFFLFKNS